MNLVTSSKEKIETCDKCQEKFSRKWNKIIRKPSQINDLHYWTGGKEINGYRIVCRDCLKKLYKEETPDSLFFLLLKAKKPTFQNYLMSGILDKNDKVNLDLS